MKSRREKIIIKTSLIGIFANFILAGFKAAVGLLSNSIAILSDSVNNLSDALSSIVTIFGTKLAGKAPDRNHPYGYGRVEYVASLVVSAIVFYAGLTALLESIEKIIHPETPNYNSFTLVVLVAAIFVKLVLGFYTKKKGKDVKSDSLVASGIDAFNDAILSISVLASTVVYLLFHLNLEAYVGILVSLFVIKTGFELIKTSVDSVLGSRVEGKLTRAIKKEALKVPKVEGVYDLVLNDYGPNKYLGSLHIEVADTLTVAEIDKISRNITKIINKKYGVLLHTIGIYSINTQDKNTLKFKQEITKIVFSYDHILEMHGFYFDEEEKTISFDIIIDFNAKNKEEIYQKIYDEIHQHYKDYKLNITLDIDVSD